MLHCGCGYRTEHAHHMDAHKVSKQHEGNMLRLRKQMEKVTVDTEGNCHCDTCGYSTVFKSNFRKHLISKKHQDANAAKTQKNTKPDDKPPTNVIVVHTEEQVKEPELKPVMLTDVMDMFFKFHSSTLETLEKQQIFHASAAEKQKIQDTEMFKGLMDRMFCYQQQQQQIQQQQQQLQQQQPLPPHPPRQLENVFIESNPTQSNSQNQTTNSQNTTTTTTSTNSHNKKFNLNFFLNEECKHAQNLSDFVKNVVISMEDLEHIGNVGYTQGMSKILTKAIQEKEEKDRPMHCTDVKRETIYIRENDKWTKDLEREETKKAIEYISNKNYKAFRQWRDLHPEYAIHDTEDYETWYRISRHMCNTDPNAVKKLVHHLATITAIEKGDMVLA